jgi:hypothetical protein
MTTSPIGCEQQTRTLPSASFLESELDATHRRGRGSGGTGLQQKQLIGILLKEGELDL